MDYNDMFAGLSISGSGMSAERMRLDTISRNIANAGVVGAPGQEPYRRQEVVFESILGDALGSPGSGPAGGVRVAEIVSDTSTPLVEINDPNHPQADPETGIVRFSNVNMVFEMVDMMTASRSYEANLRAMSTYRDMVRQTLRLLEG